MKTRLLMFTLLATLFSQAAFAEGDVALYGHAKAEVFKTPNQNLKLNKPATFFVYVLPWREAPETTLDDQVQRVLDTPPEGIEYTPDLRPKLLQLSKSLASGLPFRIKSPLFQLGAAQIYACNYKGRKEHYREIVFVSHIFGFSASGKPNVLKRLQKKSQKLCRENPSHAKRDAIIALSTTAPGEGDGADRLEQVVYSFDAGLGAGGMFEMREWTTLLFNDGWSRSGTGIPMTEFDVEASRKYAPEQWRRWRKNDDGWIEREIVKKDGEKYWSRIGGSPTTMKPAQKGTRYSGHFEYFHTIGSFSGGSSTQHDVYVMRKYGTYSSSSSRMSTNNSAGTTVSTVRTEGADGCSSATSISGGGLVGGGGKTDAACGDGRSGTYEIDGFVITLAADNGVIKRFPFYARSEKQFYMHGRMFSFAKDVE